MRSFWSFSVIVASSLAIVGCCGAGATVQADEQTEVSTLSPAKQELISQIEDIFDDERFASAHLGLLIESADTGEVWFDHQANKLFMPASNEKILTTASALNYLGPDFTFETHLCHDGSIDGETLDGNIIVFGNGDPTLYSKFYDDPCDQFRQWAGLLKEKGIHHIKGDLIGDDNAWNDDRIGEGWPHDELTPWYYAEYGPLTLNENYVDVMIHPPASVDGEVKLVPNLPSSYYTLVNKIKVIKEGNNNVWMYRPDKDNTITFSGTVVAGSKAFEKTPTITNTTKWYMHVLKEVFEEEGIKVDGDTVDCDDIDGWNHRADDFTLLTTQKSVPLSDILILLMKRSQNVYAETMVYTMGWKATGKGSFRTGREVVKEQLAKLGVEPGSYNYSDGSGLSRYNYISPRIIATIYKAMLHNQYSNQWWEAQAIAGVPPGTLRNRMKDTAAENNMRGKTGMINAVRSVSGYVKTADDEQLVLSFLINAHQRSSTEIDAMYDKVIVLLAEYSEKN
jgi:serine-type D-Ala-D-Ala carboxypeptidase/endopeptidase (penicillin-binding protein 4)